MLAKRLDTSLSAEFTGHCWPACSATSGALARWSGLAVPLETGCAWGFADGAAAAECMP